VARIMIETYYTHRAEKGRHCLFFSSRRRHTRLVSDWSSDVCSSDLWPWLTPDLVSRAAVERSEDPAAAVIRRNDDQRLVKHGRRSEERRVGKERRGRGRPERSEKKEEK